MLRDLGFTEIEARVYTFLLQNEPATGYRISHAIGKPTANTYKAVAALEGRGAVQVDEGENRLVRAVPPEELLAGLERRARDRHEAARGVLAELNRDTTDDRVYRKMLVSRPIFPLGRDIGFLPGDVEQKLNPWMKPIFDNVELLLGNVEEQGKRKRGYKELVDLGLLEIEALTYIRGRSIPKQYLIVDEAQNLTPHEIKTIVTRAGEGTKVILTGDPYQIDNPYIDASSNGLTTIVEKFKDQAIAGHITLDKGERSCLAELAANLL